MSRVDMESVRQSGEHEPCETCLRPVPQRDGERRDKWLARKTCSKKCRGRLMAMIGVRRHNKQDIPHLPCPVCRRPVERREKEQTWQFNKRQTCGEKCYLALQRRNAGGRLLCIRDRRNALGISRYELAVAARVADRTVSLVEAGHALPLAEPKILAALARFEAIEEVDEPDPGWPEITGDTLPADCFRGRNLPPRAADFRRVYQPATHIETATVLGGI